MCMSKVVLRTEGGDEEVMDEVVCLELLGEEIKLKDLLGREKILKGRLQEVDLLRHRIIVQRVD